MPFKSGNEFYNFSSGVQLVARVVKLNFINISCWDLRKSINKAEREREIEGKGAKAIEKQGNLSEEDQLSTSHGHASAEHEVCLGLALPAALPPPPAARLPGQMLFSG